MQVRVCWTTEIAQRTWRVSLILYVKVISLYVIQKNHMFYNFILRIIILWYSPLLKWNPTFIEISTVVECLRIQVECRWYLSFANHVSGVFNNFSRLTYVFGSLKNITNINTERLSYFAEIYSIMIYGILCCGCSSTSD